MPTTSGLAASPECQLSGKNDPSRVRRFLLAGVLVVATLIVYQPVVHHQFLNYDDNDYVTENAHVRSGITLQSLHWAFTSFDAANWHPLTWISHMVDCQFFGMNPAGHHYTNVLLHAVNVLFLFLLLERATRAPWRSFIVAALFALHPLNVETVAWIAERKSLLSAFFSFATIAIYGWYASSPGVRRYLLVAGAFALALLSKPMAVTLPAILLLADYWPLGRFSFDLPTLPGEPPAPTALAKKLSTLVLEKLPLFAMSAISSYITIIAQKSGGSVAATLPLSLRIKNAAVAYALYIEKTFWPTRLAVFYPHPLHSLAWTKVVAATALLCCITALVVKFYRTRYLPVGWFAFLFILVPVIGILQVGRQAMADRYAYLPLIGLFIIVVWGAAEFSERFAISPALRAAAVVCVLGATICATSLELPYWQNSLSLFTRARQLTTVSDCEIEDNLGETLYSAGRYPEAMQHFQASLAIDGRDYVAHFNIGTYLMRQGKLQDAVAAFQVAQQFSTNSAATKSILNNNGLAHLLLADYPEAERLYTAALQIDPLARGSLVGRGQAYLRQRKFRQAADDFARASAIQPLPTIYMWWGQALEGEGQTQAALSAYNQALRRAPNFPEAKSRIASLQGNR